MTNSHTLTGIWTALVTPFHEDGSVDMESFETLVRRQIDAGIDGVVVFGTTGESPTLSVQEKLTLVKKVKSMSEGKIRLMAGSGGNNTAQSVELSKLCEAGGADSLLVVTPPYNKPGLAGLIAHYEAITEAVDIPVMLYHVPARTGAFIDSEQLAKVLKNPLITAVKEASGDLSYFSKLTTLTDTDLLSGDDFTYVASLASGGKGIVSVITNVFPEAFVELTKAFRGGEVEKATSIHKILYPFCELLFCEPNPSPTKYVLSQLGLIKNEVRLPLTTVLRENETQLMNSYEQTQKLLKEVIG